MTKSGTRRRVLVACSINRLPFPIFRRICPFPELIQLFRKFPISETAPISSFREDCPFPGIASISSFQKRTEFAHFQFSGGFSHFRKSAPISSFQKGMPISRNCRPFPVFTNGWPFPEVAVHFQYLKRVLPFPEIILHFYKSPSISSFSFPD